MKARLTRAEQDKFAAESQKRAADDRAVPKLGEPIHRPRPDLIPKWATYDDVKINYRVPTLYKSMQKP